ncbi:MAG: hypothetical protein AAB732_02710 [Patescibacteria group bacterium]
MKKILISTLFVFVFVFTIAFSAIAEENTPTTNTINTTIAPKKSIAPKKIDLTCVKTAVEKRETAIIATVDVYATSIKSAFETRKTALLAAWGITDQKARNIAIKNAFAKNRVAKRTALRIYKKTRLTTWQNFTKARIACKAPATGEDMSTDMNFND